MQYASDALRPWPGRIPQFVVRCDRQASDALSLGAKMPQRPPGLRCPHLRTLVSTTACGLPFTHTRESSIQLCVMSFNSSIHMILLARHAVATTLLSTMRLEEHITLYLPFAHVTYKSISLPYHSVDLDADRRLIPDSGFKSSHWYIL